MAFSSLPAALIQVGKATKKLIFQTLKDNQDDIDTRVNSLEAGANKVILFDEIIDLEALRVGEVRWSFLTLVQYQERYGTDWVLIDGSSIAGSDLAALFGATLPDGRNRFGRILGGSASIGDLQTNQISSHSHQWYNRLASTSTDTTWNVTKGIINIVGDGTKTGGDSAIFAGADASNALDVSCYTGDVSDKTSETRPEALVLSAFVKKSDPANRDYVSVFRAPTAFDIVSAKISNLESGSSGSLSIDIFKGSALNSMASILNSDLSHTAASGDFTTSGEASFSSTALAQNDFVRFDITGIQTQQTRFHISVYGEI